jgi:anion-transporting  ArsA/GET3 family ATPase
MQIHYKKFEIFSGTGGVGKTTLATSRAVFLAEKNLQVLLITIDPAKRLKQILKLDESKEGNVTKVKWENTTFDTLLMSPPETIKRIGSKDGCPEIEFNRIVKILSKPYGGMNEILSMVELQMQHEKKVYDVIILDTPPGSHFLDFLESIEKIKTFFDESFVEIFNYIAGKKEKNRNVLTAIVSSGVKKLLDYLGKVTGAKFIDEFIEAIVIIYKTKNTFLSALELQNDLKNTEKANWFLVTSIEQNKISEALELKKHAQDFLTENSYIILNKSLLNYLKEWTPLEEEGKTLKKSFIFKEELLRKKIKNIFKHVLEFDEVIDAEPQIHVNQLANNWKKYEL